MRRILAVRLLSAKQIHTQLIRQCSSDYKQYLYISNSLFKVGCMRYESDKSSTNVYQHFSPTGSKSSADSAGGTTEAIAEFLELSELIVNFGTPEHADQLSGAMYMRGSVTEDKSSVCLRLADQHIPKYCIEDLKACLESMTWWPTQVDGSMAVTEMVKSLDLTCIDRLNSLHFSLQDQMRICHLWQSLIFTPKVDFPSHSLTSVGEFVNQSSYAVLVSFLLLLSKMHEPQVERILSSQKLDQKQFSEEIGGKFIPGMLFFSEAELVAAYMGLARMGQTAERAEIKNYLVTKFGLNLP